ncbi:MAG: hypothetical protein H6945_11710 [Zoogloeaceae bacterium]|nr:hypothetical protein [Zoogloeaceae bacterium]
MITIVFAAVTTLICTTFAGAIGLGRDCTRPTFSRCCGYVGRHNAERLFHAGHEAGLGSPN